MLDVTKRRLRPGHQLVDEGAGTPSRRRLAALRDRGRMERQRGHHLGRESDADQRLSDASVRVLGDLNHREAPLPWIMTRIEAGGQPVVSTGRVLASAHRRTVL
jgi:hypothetical protein